MSEDLAFPALPPRPWVQMDTLLLCPYMAFPLVSLDVSEFPLLVIQIKCMDTKWERGVDEWKDGSDVYTLLICVQLLSCI